MRTGGNQAAGRVINVSMALLVVASSCYRRYKGHLCINITEKGHMIVVDYYNRILDYTRKYCKKKKEFFNENSIENGFIIV